MGGGELQEEELVAVTTVTYTLPRFKQTLTYDNHFKFKTEDITVESYEFSAGVVVIYRLMKRQDLKLRAFLCQDD